MDDQLTFASLFAGIGRRVRRPAHHRPREEAILNIQTIPRSDKVVKRAFRPKLGAFVFADYPNIELKVLAFYLESIGFPSMADIFRAGGDLHVATAAGLAGVPADQVTDNQRQLGKKVNFQIVYGGGMPTLMQSLGVTAPQALELLRRYHATWPGIGWETKKNPADPGTLIHSIKQRVQTRGYITTLYGRHLHPRSMHSALNALCQGCAADLMKWAMVEVHRNLIPYDAHIVNMVHDELMLDVPFDELDAVATQLPTWMTDPRLEAVVPIMPSCEVSYTTWAEKEPYVGHNPAAALSAL